MADVFALTGTAVLRGPIPFDIKTDVTKLLSIEFDGIGQRVRPCSGSAIACPTSVPITSSLLAQLDSHEEFSDLGMSITISSICIEFVCHPALKCIGPSMAQIHEIGHNVSACHRLFG